MAEHLNASFASNVFGILPYVGDKMSCEATIVEYTQQDDDLITLLDLKNPKSHRFRLQRHYESGETFINTRHRGERMKSSETLRLIAQINGLIPNQRIQPKLHPKMYPVETSEGIYNIPGDRLKYYALAVEEQREYCFRTDGTQVQFFERKVDMPQLHIALIQEFYNCEYTGAFHIKPSGHIIIYIDGEGFALQMSTHYPPWFGCIHGGECKAHIYVTILNGRMLYRFVNHSEMVAHNHSDMPPIFNKPPIDTPPLEVNQYNFTSERIKGKLYAENITDDMFDNAGIIQRVENKNQIFDANTGKFYNFFRI